MGIDTSIYNQLLRPPKSVVEYDAEAMAGQQNKLALQMGRAKMDEYQRGVDDEQAVRGVVSKFGADKGANYNTLLGAGRLKEAQAYEKSNHENVKVQREAEKATLEGHFQKFKMAAQIMNGVKDQPSWDRARAETAQVFGPEAAAQMPAEYNPMLIEEKRAQGMTVLEKIENEWKAKGFDLKEKEFAYQQENDAANRSTTIRGQNLTAETTRRGQNMTDARSRESRADALSRPFEVAGPDGAPMLVQQSKAGIVPVEGYSPKRAAQKPVPAGVVKTLTEARDNAVTMDRINTEFKDEFGGKGIYGLGADLSMAVKGNTGTDQKSVAFWKDYRKNAELVERHAMFGASLTPGEQASWRSADVAPGMDPAVIKTNLATRAALAKKVAAATADDMVDAGHNETRVRAIAGRGENKPKPAMRVTNAADYAKVPSGAEYTDPSGQIRRKP